MRDHLCSLDIVASADGGDLVSSGAVCGLGGSRGGALAGLAEGLETT